MTLSLQDLRRFVITACVKDSRALLTAQRTHLAEYPAEGRDNRWDATARRAALHTLDGAFGSMFPNLDCTQHLFVEGFRRLPPSRRAHRFFGATINPDAAARSSDDRWIAIELDHGTGSRLVHALGKAAFNVLAGGCEEVHVVFEWQGAAAPAVGDQTEVFERYERDLKVFAHVIYWPASADESVIVYTGGSQ